MRIASFNVENLSDAPDTDVPLAARLDSLQPQLARMEADILCLQEVDATREGSSGNRRISVLDPLLEGTAYEGFHRAGTVHPKTGYPSNRHNLVVLSRWPMIRQAQYQNDLVTPPRYGLSTGDPPAESETEIVLDRPVQHVEIALPDGAPLHIINMHLKAPIASPIPGQRSSAFTWRSVPGWAEGYFLSSVKRSSQALEARMVADLIFDKDPSALIAMAGDFNAEENEPPLRIVTADPLDTGSGDLAGRSLVLLELSMPESRRYTVIHHGRRMMLDHLLVSRPLLGHYRGIEVHNEMLGDEVAAYTKIDAAPDSFHAPIVAEFDLNPAGAR